jgi:hypothetical protein
MDLKELIEVLDRARLIFGDQPLLVLCVLAIAFLLIITSIIKVFEYTATAFAVVRDVFRNFKDVIKGGADYREHIQRRRQFLSVLSSDLASIGKAEAWNDQNFTDLEAEVQIEGGYFASVFDRIRNHRSYAQRRERSLIGAIDGSAERCLLLTGDPGGGKSVALRHLAVQMIERARSSNRMYVPIPLYINLRELTAHPVIDADAIKKFVIDNVRRGDADTADYIKRNWSVFNEKGGWFFLFDSFDEIPEVLHSASEDLQIDRYGRAIQQFMDGLGRCRGVLASREYKSPKALAWPRLRILPLNEGLQEELVSRTFLTKLQKSTVLHALSRSHSSTFRNPLFLTLLCRYVRENESSPRNEHELLYRHVDSLCERDEDYVVSRWGLDAAAMKEAAAELARIFALAPDMGLSPSIDEIVKEVKADSVIFGRVESVIEALTYVKVGRMDVAATSRRERRFAFSHRRYHEAVFARYLSENVGVVGERELLSNPRWREYVVALLQMNTPSAEASLIDAAGKMFSSSSANVRYNEERISGFSLKTYAWQDELLIHLLKLMVEVKKYNPSSAWSAVEQRVDEFFSPLWNRGDLFDRLMIIRFGGAGSSEGHSRRIEYARKSEVAALQEEAVSSCQFATSPSENVADWIRTRVVTKIISSSKNLDALRWEALAAQLPAAYEVGVCIDRAKKLRKQHRYARMVMRPLSYLFGVMDEFFKRADSDLRSYSRFRSIMMMGGFVPVCMASSVLFALIENEVMVPLWGAMALVMVVGLVVMAITHVRLENISSPKKIGFSELISVFQVDYKIPLLTGAMIVLLSALVSLPGLVALWVVKRFGVSVAATDSEVVALGSFSFLLIAGCIVSALAWWWERKEKAESVALLRRHKSLKSIVAGEADGERLMRICNLAVIYSPISMADIRRSVSVISEKILRRSAAHGRQSRPVDLYLAGAVSVLISRIS